MSPSIMRDTGNVGQSGQRSVVEYSRIENDPEHAAIARTIKTMTRTLVNRPTNRVVYAQNGLAPDAREVVLATIGL